MKWVHTFARKLTYLSFFLLVLIAIVVCAGRIMLPQIFEDEAAIKERLQQEFHLPVEFESISGSWSGFTPIIRVENIKLPNSNDPDSPPALTISYLRMQLDLFASLIQRKPIFQAFFIEGVHFALEENTESKWSVLGFKKDAAIDTSALLKMILQQQNIYLKDVSVDLFFQNGTKQSINQISLQIIKNPAANIYDLSGRIKFPDSTGKLIFRVNVNGSPLDFPKVSANFYVALHQIELNSSFIGFPWLQEKFELEAVNVELGKFWGGWKENYFTSLIGEVDLPSLNWQVTKKFPSLENLATTFFLTMDKDKSANLQLLHTNFESKIAKESKKFSFDAVQLLRKNLDQRMQYLLALDSLHLEDTVQLLNASNFLSENTLEIINTLNPQGKLTQLTVAYSPATETIPQDFYALANLENVAISAWKNAPSGKGINGYLYVDANSGVVELASDDFTLDFPKLFSTGWHYDVANGIVKWEITEDEINLRSNVIKLHTKEGEFNGQFHLTVDRHGHEDVLSLQVGLTEVDASLTRNYLPKKIPPELHQWLNAAIKTGTVREGGFLYHGKIKPDANEAERTIAMYFDVVNATVDYQPKKWPELTGVDAFVNIDIPKLEVTVAKGMLSATTIQQAVITLANAKQKNLHMTIQALGSIQDSLNILQQSPLQEKIGPVIADWKTQGDVAATINITIPLGRTDATVVEVASQMKSASITVPHYKIAVSDITGKINYHSARGARGEFSANFLGDKIKAQIKDSTQQKSYDTELVLTGRMNTGNLATWVDKRILEYISGASPYRLTIGFPSTLHSKRERADVSIQSELQGIEVKLPADFGKPKKEKKSFNLQARLQGKPMQVSVDYGADFHGLFEMNEKNLQRGSILLGQGKPRLNHAEGLVVNGVLNVFDVSAWKNFANDIARKNTDVDFSSQSGLLKSINLQIKELILLNQRVADAVILVEQKPTYFAIDAKMPMLSGTINWYKNNVDAHEINLDYLFINTSENKDIDVLADVDPMSIPSINFSTKKLYLNDDNLGECAFKIRSTDKGQRPGLFIEDIVAEAKNLQLKSSLYWTKKSGQHYSELRADFKADNVEDVLTDWGLEPALSSKKAYVETELAWDGSPANFSIQKARGIIKMKLEEGQIREADSTSTSLLRVFGILNDNTLLRRLRLDFSDLTEAGLSYDTIKGSVHIVDGKMDIQDVLKIEGPSANIELTGTTNLITHELNQEMLVILPLTSNLPLAATAVGAPQVGGIIYIADKILGKTPLKDVINKITSVNYSIRGNWENPIIEKKSIIKDSDNRKQSTEEKPKSQEK